MKPGRYDVFVDFSRGEFVVENLDTRTKHTWPCELRITGPEVQSEVQSEVVLGPRVENLQWLTPKENSQKANYEFHEPGVVYSDIPKEIVIEPEVVVEEDEKKPAHICKGTGAKPPIALCKNHTECHKQGYELCEPYDSNSAFGRTPPAFIDTVQVCPPNRDESLYCENCEWDGVCSLKFLGNLNRSSKQMFIWVEDASHNVFHIPRAAVISYEEKKGKEKKRIIKENLRQRMEEEIESLLIDFSVKESTIEKFIISHAAQFADAVDKMYKEYKADGELDDLKNPENDWVREYMGEILKDIDFENECIRKAAGPKGDKPKKSAPKIVSKKPPSYLEIQYTGDKPKNTIIKDGYKYKLDGTGMDLRTGQRDAFYVRGKKVEK
jgi:hypothetical protein